MNASPLNRLFLEEIYQSVQYNLCLIYSEVLTINTVLFLLYLIYRKLGVKFQPFFAKYQG